MDESMVQFLIEMRKEMFSGDSVKHKEIVNKLDEMILVELKKATTQETL